MARLLFALLWLCLSFGLQAASPIKPEVALDHSEVRLPLRDYTALAEQAKGEKKPAPAAYAFGHGRVQVLVHEAQKKSQSAVVSLSFELDVHEDKQWTKVPLFAQPVAYTYAKVDGKPVQLMRDADGLSWVSRKAGTYQVALEYVAEVDTGGHSAQLDMPLPPVTASELNIVLPQPQLSVSVTPAVSQETVSEGEQTHVLARLPATQQAHILWQVEDSHPYALSRVLYQGEEKADAIHWNATFTAQVFANDPLLLPLLPASATLTDMRLNGEPATILYISEEGDAEPLLNLRKIRPQPVQVADYFGLRLPGAGQYQISLSFQTQIDRHNGPPSTELAIPAIPISHFEVTLPGRKELSVEPATSVSSSYSGEGDAQQTRAVWYLPMSEHLSFSWAEAIPEDVKDELRANASLYHAVHAEEGVLHGRAFVEYEITRGETNVLSLTAPADIQINRIEAEQGGVSDWRSTPDAEGGEQQIQVFLDRQVKGDFKFVVHYERLLGGAASTETGAIAVPVLRAAGVHRQRGMLALLSGPELALKPEQAERVSKVGENQLPDFVRNALSLTVAHTYKYIDPAPLVVAAAVAPERKAGKFDAQVDTLISIGDVTLSGSASVELNVKSGSLMALDLALPNGVNLLGLSSPSMRTYQTKTEDKQQLVHVEFTQEMQGQFRMEVNYEQILADTSTTLKVPTVAVVDAEVEYGRIAVEALAAVEIQPMTLENLSSLDLNELPQQLVLKTTNPILLAYRYVHPPYVLALKITRHKELAVQVASIEQARYDSLVTRDGLVVTTARYNVRNSRQQFLRLDLPPEAEVWSVFVGDKGEKPAQTDDGKGVLIRMMNDTNGFPLEIVYAVQLHKIDDRGDIKLLLPRPDILVTRTRWDIYLPYGPYYQVPESNMEMLLTAELTDEQEIRKNLSSARHQQRSLQLHVPTQGVHYAFTKLYANKSPEDAYMHLHYVSEEGLQLGYWLNILGTLLLAFGLLILTRGFSTLPPSSGLPMLAVGLVTIAYASLQLAASFGAVLMTCGVLSLLLGVLWMRHYWLSR